MTGAFCKISRAPPCGSIAAARGGWRSASAQFETRRDEILAEEELEQHKLGRKIVEEEHWVRYGVTARRKRNVRRMAELQDLRKERQEFRGAAGKAVIAVGRSREIRRARDRGQRDFQGL